MARGWGGKSVRDPLQRSVDVAIVGVQRVFIGLTVDRGEFETAARPLNNESARRHVPQTDARLDVGVETSVGDISQGEGSRSHQADLSNLMDEFAEDGKHAIKGVLAFREPERNNGFREPGAWTDLNLPTVEPCRSGRRGCPGFIKKWIVHDPHEGRVSFPVPDLKGDAHAGVGNAMRVVHGSINGVNDPSGIRFLDGGVATFFAEDGDVRKVQSQLAGDESLAADVEVQLDVMLRRLIDLLGSPEVSPHEFAGSARGGFSGGQCSGGGDRFHSNLAIIVSGPLPFPKREGADPCLGASRRTLLSRGPPPLTAGPHGARPGFREDVPAFRRSSPHPRPSEPPAIRVPQGYGRRKRSWRRRRSVVGHRPGPLPGR